MKVSTKKKIFKKIEEINRKITELSEGMDLLLDEYSDDDEGISKEESFWRNAPSRVQFKYDRLYDELRDLDEQKSKLYKMLQKLN